MAINNKQFYYKNYYNLVDGVYCSYWVGKLTNTLMLSGHKITIVKNMEHSYFFIKIYYKILPLEIILEGLEKTKPLFGLSYVLVGGKKREFPRFLPHSKQLRFAVQWFRECIQTRHERNLNQRIFNMFCDIYVSKRHALIKKRDNLFNQAVAHRFNIRFIY